MCMSMFFFQVQELRLQRSYSEDNAVYKYIRKLMALPFLPHCQINQTFLCLQVETQTEPLENLVKYIKRQWIESTVFPPKNWSVFKQAIRTNNNIEGSTMLWIVMRAGSVDYLCTILSSSWIERRGLQLSPSGLSKIGNWSGSSRSSTETCRQCYSTAGRRTRGKRRPPHSCWKSVLISTARLVGTEELKPQKTAPLEATKFAKENDQQ